MGRKESGAIEPIGNSTGAVAYLHRDLSTQNQVAMLLSVSQTMLAGLIQPDRDAENIPGSRPFPGEARLALETTLIKACNRLDEILEDKTRWTPEFQLALEKQLEEHRASVKEIAAAQIKAAEAEEKKSRSQKAAADEVASPHFRYKPQLLHLEDGQWLAFLGDPNDPASRIIGLGASPESALGSFDRAFQGKIPQSLKDWLGVREEQLEQGIDKNYDKTMDGSGPAAA